MEHHGPSTTPLSLRPPYTTGSSQAASDEDVPTMFATAALRLEAAEAALHDMTHVCRTFLLQSEPSCWG